VKHPELVERLDRHADRLTERVLAEMYKNPFWLERFGDRAQRHGRQDGRFHIDYLMQAVGSEDAGVLENYARWLQQVLTTRGMCSRHLAENFDRLAAEIAAEGWPDAQPAVDMLGAATRALRYSSAPAREIQEHASVLVAATVDVLYVRHPEWNARWGEAGRARCLDDVDYHVSYAADAVALERTDVFVSYAQWIADFLARRHIPREHLVETLEVLGHAPAANAELRRVIDAALVALRA
jgi:hypothetical protein